MIAINFLQHKFREEVYSRYRYLYDTIQFFILVDWKEDTTTLQSNTTAKARIHNKKYPHDVDNLSFIARMLAVTDFLHSINITLGVFTGTRSQEFINHNPNSHKSMTQMGWNPRTDIVYGLRRKDPDIICPSSELSPKRRVNRFFKVAIFMTILGLYISVALPDRESTSSVINRDYSKVKSMVTIPETNNSQEVNGNYTSTVPLNLIEECGGSGFLTAATVNLCGGAGGIISQTCFDPMHQSVQTEIIEVDESGKGTYSGSVEYPVQCP